MQYNITSEKDYNLVEFVSLMAGMHSRLEPTIHEVAAELPEGTTITAVCYEYDSIDHQGKAVRLSSLMLIPRLGGEFTAPRLFIENRATQAADKSVPTHQWNIGEAHVLTNSVLVSPDLISFGASVHYPICYVHAQMAARHTVDAAIAAQMMLMEYFRLTEKPLPVYNSGHSQGGFDALAVHRYMETEATAEERRMLPLVQSNCASGPYVPDVLMEIVAKREKYLYGAYMVLNAMSHLHYHAEWFDKETTIADFLTPAAQESGLVEMIASKEHSNSELVKTTINTLGTRTAALFQEDVYKEDGHIYGMMQKASEQDRLIDHWKPTLPIYFYHATHDECVPVECMDAVREAWGDLPNVFFEYDDYQDDPMVHRYSGGAFARKVLRSIVKA